MTGYFVMWKEYQDCFKIYLAERNIARLSVLVAFFKPFLAFFKT